MEEIFKIIEEYPNYTVSNFGNVKGNYSGIILKPYYNEKGYCKVSLCTPNQKHVNRFIHRLVANTFIKNPNNYDQVNHIDGNKSNNIITNLEWCNYTQNKLHAITKLNAFDFLKSNPIARKLTVDNVIHIKHILKTNTVTTELIHIIASEYKVNPQTIRCIYWGKTWQQVE